MTKAALLMVSPLSQDNDHPKFMRKCLALAKRGSGTVSPNPMVGSVLVHNGRIVAEGWHKAFGGPHAEVNAIMSLNTPEILPQTTLYVNLEPCAHFGKTPPCANLIIEKKIPRVVIGCRDPHKKVSGKGIKLLREAGIEVIEGILQEECEQLNEAFITYHKSSRPFFALKAAQSLDGRIATATKDSKWVTSEAARAYGHLLRASYDAIMIGTGTALSDNPSLSVRDVKGKNPKRIVLDRKLRIPLSASLFDASAETLLFTSKVNRKHPKLQRLREKKVEVYFVSEKPYGLNLAEIAAHLYDASILSVLVEGGGTLHATLLRQGVADKCHLFVAPKFLGSESIAAIGALGIKSVSNAVELDHYELKLLHDTLLIEGYFKTHFTA